ncbi:MAG: bifunctional DNA-formamidopyrimidine glycosylase/DNA-(apurinic or apyrimidinic site) lyase [Gammaproteobacteria bacterium]|nr:bifunctional DNA-formamidopyrimidine glycosylase/DNA-(apurinic or apyrimidinic site) lyase [Gammaproteobacteria bacterium]MDE2262497.1 bifunctional DNA-formamidopyrimidine glycosylase/DNA-(apurinic or apyrimidinic site) lyase [Gammaproteobacteria bacterium]
MPELPEVEITRRVLEPHITGRRIVALKVREPRLRWRVKDDLPAKLAGQRITGTARRAKYLLIRLEAGTLLVHLGMSGSLRILPAGTRRRAHDHYDLLLDSGNTLRFNDPRRFGSLHYTSDDPSRHPLLARLAPEPFDPKFDASYMWRITRRRRTPIKQVLMNSRLVVGVGNIYASEILFRALIRPRRQAQSLSREEVKRLAKEVRAVLEQALEAGGTTLRDFVAPDGELGYFSQSLYVYGRKECRACGTPVRHLTQQGRSSYYCPACQR